MLQATHCRRRQTTQTYASGDTLSPGDMLSLKHGSRRHIVPGDILSLRHSSRRHIVAWRQSVAQTSADVVSINYPAPGDRLSQMHASRRHIVAGDRLSLRRMPQETHCRSVAPRRLIVTQTFSSGDMFLPGDSFRRQVARRQRVSFRHMLQATGIAHA